MAVRARGVLAVALVVLAAAGGALAALTLHAGERRLSVGTVRMDVDPGHRGALDLYVPLVDWGVRFGAVRMPARLRIDLRTVDRDVVQRLAGGQLVDVEAVRAEGEAALEAYIRSLVAVVLLGGVASGGLIALALRDGPGPRLRWLAASGTMTAAVSATAVAVLLPPRGDLTEPEYYAHGSDIPRALRAIDDVADSARTLSDELDDQLVGLARLVSAPGARLGLGGLPRVTVASDLHNNVLALPTLERAAEGGPLLFAGDLTDRGSPFEVGVTRRVARAGRPFVFVTGNHDSDVQARDLARAGAVVLTERGRLGRDGDLGEVVVRIGGLRVAGYSDPFERREAEDYADRAPREGVPRAEQEAFADWLRPLVGEVDVVMVHSPEVAGLALGELRDSPPADPLVLVTGHTHRAKLEVADGVVGLNGGSVGGGGTGNLGEDTTVALGALIYEHERGFRPLAADLVEIEPGTGSSRAQRRRLDPAGP
jgi:predicted phosphodiesterase